MQRLFSSFADGWPDVGLLLQRILTASLLIRFEIFELTGTSYSPFMITQIIGPLAGILLLIGLWTPVVGTLIALIELWAAANVSNPWIPIVLATLGGTVANDWPGSVVDRCTAFRPKTYRNIKQKQRRHPPKVAASVLTIDWFRY